MNEKQIAKWMLVEYGSRLHPGNKGRAYWILDGKPMRVIDIWAKLVNERIQSGEITIAFPENVDRMYIAMQELKLLLKLEVGNGVG